MTKRTRTIIFLTCFLLFALIAPSAVLYSQGYRIDLENRKFTQTGGLFIKAAPKQADVYIDGKLEKRTDFFFGSVLIENLLPNKYNVEIKKEGYHSWEKALEIKERQVQEVKNAILFPQNVNFNVLSSQVERLWFSPDQRKMITQEEEKLGWALKLYDLDKNIKSRLTAKEDIFLEESELVDLNFSADSKRIDLEIAAKERIRYFVLELDKITPVPTETTDPQPAIENAVVYQRINNDIYYLDESGRLFKNGAELTSQPFPIKQETKYVLSVFQNYVFLQETDTLYKFNNDSKSFEIFFDRIESLKISPDNKKLVYFSEHEIWILFLNDKNDPPQKKSGEKTFLMRLSEKITDVFWMNDNYLIFAAGDVIKISEIDDRDKLNVADIFEIKKLPENGSLIEMFWNQSDKKLYLLKEKSLYSSDVLLP
jgi:hypothetical protein